NYFGYGPRSKAYRSVDQYVFERVRRFLVRRHKVQGRGNRRFTFDVIHRELRRSVPPTPAPSGPVACLAVKPAGKPDAGNRHVRFDERGWETGRWPKAQATAPILDSTKCDIDPSWSFASSV